MEWCSHCDRLCNTACQGSFLCCRECGKVLADIVVKKKKSGRSGKSKSGGVKRDGCSSSQACSDEESSNVG